MNAIDVRGLSCPLPVLKTKQALDKGMEELQVLGSGQTAQQNVVKFAKSQGCDTEIVNKKDDEWQIIITKRPGK